MATNREALKSGIWYTISNFSIRGIALITTPIFSRILTQEEYGGFSNFASWVSLLAICLTFDLESTLIVARFEHKDHMEKYIFSMFVLSSLGVIFIWVLVNLFPNISSSIFSMELRYINMMMAYVFFLPIINIFTTWERFQYKYKVTIVISGAITILSAVIGISIVYITGKGMWGRTMGFILPTILIGLFIYLKLFFREKIPDVKYWLYALPICLPFIPHLLSLNILNSVDRIMITQFCGTEENALYSIAYSVGAIVTILVSAMNSAYSPWLSDNLHNSQYEIINKYSYYYVLFFLWLAIGIIILSPEVLLFMGGKRYMEAMHCMPPIAMGCVFQFIYCMYVNIEQYTKKTVGMAVVSVISACLNFILNYIFIPRYGYIAAAYTTLISYLWLMLSHIYLVYKLKFSYIYKNKKILINVCIMFIFSICINTIYDYKILRYTMSICYFVITMIVGIVIIIKYDIFVKLKMEKK